jgi:hypothetical protein
MVYNRRAEMVFEMCSSVAETLGSVVVMILSNE